MLMILTILHIWQNHFHNFNSSTQSTFIYAISGTLTKDFWCSPIICITIVGFMQWPIIYWCPHSKHKNEVNKKFFSPQKGLKMNNQTSSGTRVSTLDLNSCEYILFWFHSQKSFIIMIFIFATMTFYVLFVWWKQWKNSKLGSFKLKWEKI